MGSSHDFQHYRSAPPGDMLVSLVTSILLHSILLVASSYWLRAFVPQPNQKISQETPIEVVEVTPDKTHIPPQTSLRAVKDSIAGGKALPERPVSAVKSANPAAHQASTKNPKDLIASSPTKVFQPKRKQQNSESPNLSLQQPQAKPRKTSPAPLPEKIAVAPKTIPVAPKPEPTAAPTKSPAPLPEKIAVVPKTIPAAPKPEPTAAPTRSSAPLPEKIAVAPKTIPAAPKPEPTAAPATKSPAPYPQKSGQSETRLSGRTSSQGQPSLKTTGAASLLGGPVSVSSRSFNGDYLAALPNSNRDNQAPAGIDAKRQDIDITSYLNQLQQRVKQQWLPGISQSSRRTVLDFTVNRSGQVSNLQIAQTSGFSVTDKGALNAIQRAAPFAPLPTGYKSNYIHIQFTFNINVYGELNVSGDGG
ncbi:TonB family protein [Nostoc sp. UHCC 0302]|uniref:TonB family protein n=1 Tax=Nostoc sp. UHCC 0302 TaxID=3134896 RepID=UPI00311C8C22